MKKMKSFVCMDEALKPVKLFVPDLTEQEIKIKSREQISRIFAFLRKVKREEKEAAKKALLEVSLKSCHLFQKIKSGLSDNSGTFLKSNMLTFLAN